MARARWVCGKSDGRIAGNEKEGSWGPSQKGVAGIRDLAGRKEHQGTKSVLRLFRHPETAVYMVVPENGWWRGRGGFASD